MFTFSENRVSSLNGKTIDVGSNPISLYFIINNLKFNKMDKIIITEPTKPCTLHSIIGSVFTMQSNKWKVKTKGVNGMYGVECQNHNHSFISMHIDEISELLDK